MSRDLDSALLAELGAPVVKAVLLFEAEFIGGWLYLWTGYGDLEWNGNTYLGIGGLIGLTPIEETGEIRATGLTVTLAGLDAGITSIALQELAQNKTGRILFGMLAVDDMVGDGADVLGDDDEQQLGTPGGSWVGAGPEIVFEGRLDLGTIREEPSGATVTINYESRLVNLETPRRWAWTDRDQRVRFPDDLGCNHTGTIADQILQWG